MFRFHCSLNSHHRDFETSGANLISLDDMNTVKARFVRFADKTYLDCSTESVLINHWNGDHEPLKDPLKDF